MIEFAVFEFDQYPLNTYRTQSHLLSLSPGKGALLYLA